MGLYTAYKIVSKQKGPLQKQMINLLAQPLFFVYKTSFEILFKNMSYLNMQIFSFKYHNSQRI